MSDMKNYFPLTGNKTENFSWILKEEDLPFKGLDVNPREWIASFSMPSLYINQIPKRFLDKFPGFYIFCRETVPSHYPSWILSPWSQDFLNNKRSYYQLRQNKDLDPQKTKVFCGVQNLKQLNSLKDVYQGPSHYFYKDVSSNECHAENQLHLYRDVFNRPYFFFDLVDLHFSGFSYLHFTCLARGGVIKTNQSLLESSPSKTIRRWYGNWELFLLEDHDHD
jgi:hypothetical protein